MNVPNSRQNDPMEMLGFLRQLKTNPAQVLLQRGYKVPENMSTDPDTIIQYLLNTGQVTQDRYDRAVSMAKCFRF